ncbi:MAG: TIM44-like domain-containing protein, partial [Thermoanaerobaculia bacterium]
MAKPPLSRALPFLAFLALLVLPAAAEARPGGGQSYSGGSHGGSGGGGGGGGCIWLLFRLWLELVIRYPAIGIPLTIVGIVVFLSYQKRKAAAGSQGWDSAPVPTVSSVPSPMAYPAPAARPSRSSRDLDDVRQLDPEFSVVLFQDFAYALYAKAHEARSNPRDLESLSPYLSQNARDQLARRPPVGAPVSGVVIGAMRVVELSLPTATAAGAPQAQVTVVLELEANMTVGPTGTSGGAQTHYVRERWRLVRDAGVQSKPPEQVGTFHCPNCGAPFGPEGGDRCQYCGQVVSGGRFDWSVTSIDLLDLEERPPALTSDVQEMGTDLPTLLHPRLNARWTELVRDDPAVTQDALAARFKVIYDELNAAWTHGDLATVRPYVSDGLFDYLQYWVTAYRTQGLRNVLEGMRIVQWKAVKIIRDRHYDSLTIRLWGTGRDYTVRTVRDTTGERVSGNPNRDRFYSEYW